MKRWFCPRPWTTPVIEVDVRPGGSSFIVMQGPNGERHETRGVYLAVEPERRLVFTDAYIRAWEPSEKPFMTATVTFEDEGEGTRYVARAVHWTEEDRIRHEQMGFHEGWGKAADQLEEVAREIA